MPGKVGVKIKAGRNLPVMDRSSDTTDAYVEIKLGNVTHKTDVCRKSLNPQWNTDWFRFELLDAELQDEPLQIRLMDHDTYSANDAIGKVNISLNPLCLETAGHSSHGKGAVMSGWIPVFDTMHGIRGEINIIVKVDLFSDVNKFRQSSCGIQFFHSQTVPYGYRAQVLGFVEELVVNDDPEYQWIDKIRTPRASNEARQVVFLRLSGQVQRKMGLKAINLGANAVIGFTQCLDLEGDVGVVARGIGTAVILVKIQDGANNQTIVDNALMEEQTLKYLEFLTGSREDLHCSSSRLFNVQNETNLHPSIINLKAMKKSLSSGQINKSTELLESHEIIKSLVRQEEERDDKPPRTFKQHVRRFTQSSRTILNQKYSAFKKAIRDNNDNIGIRPSLSLKSLNTVQSNVTVDKKLSVNLEKNQPQNHHHLHHYRTNFLNQECNKKEEIKTSHHIARSVSDGFQVTKSYKHQSVFESVSEFQENTQSSPNICLDNKTKENPRTINSEDNIEDNENLKENHFVIPKTVNSASTLSTSSKTTDECFDLDYSDPLLCDERDKSTITLMNTNYIEDNESKITAAKLEKILNICCADNSDFDNWIQPGVDDSIDDNIDLPKKHTIFDDIKNFSMKFHTKQDGHHVKNETTKTKIELKSFTAGSNIDGSNKILKKDLKLNIPLLLQNQFKSIENQSMSNQPPFYSSQPEILTLVQSQSSPPLMLPFCSLTNLSKTESDICAKNNSENPDFPNFSSYKYPIVQVCPCTPSTASDSENANDDLSSIPSSNRSLNSGSSNTINSYLSMYDLERTQQQLQPNLMLNDRHVNLRNNCCTNTGKLSLLAPSTPLCIKNHRSSCEIVGVVSGDVPDNRFSPVSKRQAHTNSEFTSTNQRHKLSPSPSKLGNLIGGTKSNALATTTALPATVEVAAATTTAAEPIVQSAPAQIHSNTETQRRSSDSDLSITPKGNSMCVASERLVAATAMMKINQTAGNLKNSKTENIDMLEYPFLTIKKYPPGFILHLGATVAARSVKLLERVPNQDEPEVRDSWWTELRMEIRSHARALDCNIILGYSETTTISDEVCVLSATGTAAVINMQYNCSASQTDLYGCNKNSVMSTSLEDRERDAVKENKFMSNSADGAENLPKDVPLSSSVGGIGITFPSSNKKNALPSLSNNSNSLKKPCTMCHIPYNLSSVPFNIKMKKCSICRRGKVPDVLMTTLEIPDYLQITGRGCFMQAQVVRAKKDLRSEMNAKEISDGLPFLEYELHRVLINKLKAKGMNAIFGLRSQVSIGERMMALIATGTAVFLTALPTPKVPKIVAGNSWTDKAKLIELQKKLQETYDRNREIYQLKFIDPDIMPYCSNNGGEKQPQSDDTDDSDDEIGETDLNCGNKDTCVLEVDDIEDLEIISLLMEPYPPEGFHVVNTQLVPGMHEIDAVKSLQMFAQVWRAKFDLTQNPNGFSKHFQRLLQTIFYKLRSMIPCAICDLRFLLEFPESDHIQLLVTGMALGLGDASKLKFRRKTLTGTSSDSKPSEMNGSSFNKKPMPDEEYIFPLDEDATMSGSAQPSSVPSSLYGTHSLRIRKTSPSQNKNNSSVRPSRCFPMRERFGVDITPLCFVPGGRIEKYLGNLNFYFIRESTSIREIGGMSGFIHSFITELLAVVRAHISALGGNAMVSLYMTELILVDNQHKNQGQCLVSIGGDVVNVSYFTDD